MLHQVCERPACLGVLALQAPRVLAVGKALLDAQHGVLFERIQGGQVQGAHGLRQTPLLGQRVRLAPERVGLLSTLSRLDLALA